MYDRHAGEPVEGYGKKDKTTGKRVDLYYLTIRGLDKIDFGSKDKDACLLGVSRFTKYYNIINIMFEICHTV